VFGEPPPRPLRPHIDYVHIFSTDKVPVSVEGSLLHAFTRKPGGYPIIARWIFNESLEASIAYFQEHAREIRAETPRPLVDGTDAYITLWGRTTLPFDLLRHYEEDTSYDGFTRTKVKEFVKRHLVQGELPAIDALCIYEPFGESTYPDDRSLRQQYRRAIPNHLEEGDIPIVTGRRVEWLAREIRNTWSDDHVCEEFAEGRFTYDPLQFPRDVPSIIRQYSIYCACIALINRGECNVQALVDLFYNCLTYEKMLDSYLLSEGQWWSFWYYPLETRVFTGDYLPNYFHTLSHMALCGENDSPDHFPLMSIWSKCMPFACQQRDLMNDLYAYCMKYEAFWRFFSKLMWCMLAGLYPSCAGQEVTDMRKLLRIKHLCENRAILMDALCRVGRDATAMAQKERERNASIVATAFRLYTVHLIHYNGHFAEAFSGVMDWDTFKVESVALGNTIRHTNLYMVDDPFMEARKRITTFSKDPDGKRKIYRFRKHPCITTLLSECNKVIQKIIVPDPVEFQREIDVLLQVANQGDAHRLAEYRAIYDDYFADAPRNTWSDIARQVNF
jgi:hypothetical protein